MMLTQSRGGHIFNIDGAGSDGRPTPRFPKVSWEYAFAVCFRLSVMSNSNFFFFFLTGLLHMVQLNGVLFT